MLFDVETVERVIKSVEVAYFRTESHRRSHRYAGPKRNGVHVQKCGGGRRIIRKKVAA